MFTRILELKGHGKYEMVGVAAIPRLALRIFIGRPSMGEFMLNGISIRGDIYIEEKENSDGKQAKVQLNISRNEIDKNGHSVPSGVENLCYALAEKIFALAKDPRLEVAIQKECLKDAIAARQTLIDKLETELIQHKQWLAINQAALVK